MYKYHCLNPISDVGLERLTEEYVPVSTMEKADAVLVRSTVMHEMEFSPKLKAIARAGAGVNNIPLEKCAEKGIVVFNTPGANANGVKEQVIAGMLLASRDIVGGINWVQENEEDGNIAKDAEKAKKSFAGCELSLESSALAPLACWWPTPRRILAWMYTGMIPMCPLIRHGGFHEASITRSRSTNCTETVIISRFMFRRWSRRREWSIRMPSV